MSFLQRSDSLNSSLDVLGRRLEFSFSLVHRKFPVLLVEFMSVLKLVVVQPL